MSESAADTTPAPAPTGFGENKGIKFTVKTGGKTWQCVLEDRAVHERRKAVRSGSADSIETSSSGSSKASP